MKWTEKEVRLLKLHYETNISWTRLKGYFPNRNINSIKRKAKREGLNREHLAIGKYLYAYCIVHGRIMVNEVKWKESKTKKNIRGRCPYCNRQLRNLTSNKLSLKEKYK